MNKCHPRSGNDVPKVLTADTGKGGADPCREWAFGGTQDLEHDILSGVESELGNRSRTGCRDRENVDSRAQCHERQWPAQGHKTGVRVSFPEATGQET